jgi:ribosomal protein S18 acetylase RimI-like enzyme
MDSAALRLDLVIPKVQGRWPWLNYNAPLVLFNAMIEIRSATEPDKPAIWKIIQAVIATGDTYVFAPDAPEDEMIAYWFSPEKHVYVAEDGGEILGTYWLKANQPGLGSHVGNGAYMVSPNAKGKGIGRLMAEHSIEEARRIGFKSIQFNFVVKCNEVAVKLWKSVGFEIIGEIPDAFNHREHGMTNALIMYRKL